MQQGVILALQQGLRYIFAIIIYLQQVPLQVHDYSSSYLDTEVDSVYTFVDEANYSRCNMQMLLKIFIVISLLNQFLINDMRMSAFIKKSDIF